MSTEEEDNISRTTPKSATKRNSNPGVRRQGGRLYDSVNGKTCHWCRQKTVENHVQCCKCPIRFCGPCLKNRNGEDIVLEMQEGNSWVCPKCRNGCGPGCNQCCNCGPCRKSQGLEKTGIIVHHARGAGFSNAHDYLVFQNTHESPYEIACRKKGRGWCKSADHFLVRPEEFGTQVLNTPMISTDQLRTNYEASHKKGNVGTSTVSPSSEGRLHHESNTHERNILDLNKRLNINEGHESSWEEKLSLEARVVGCQTNDTSNEKTCHRCRKRSLQDHVHCSRCPYRFCGLCLMNRHGEDISLEMQVGNAWVCPRCRKGCGPGCMNCCNCSHCRKEQGLEVIGPILHLARNAGFTNVHDFLIFKTTHESPREISHRKLGRGWCRSAEYFWTKPEDFELHSQRSPLRYTVHKHTLTTNERMRGSLSEEQVKQLPKSYLPEGYIIEQKSIKLPNDSRASCHKDNLDSITADSVMINSFQNNTPIHSIFSDAAPEAVVSTPLFTQTSGITSKIALQHQDPIPHQLETKDLSKQEGNGSLLHSSPAVNIDSGNMAKVEAQLNIDSSLLGCANTVKVETESAMFMDSSLLGSVNMANADSSMLGSGNLVKVEAQPLHNAFSRDAEDSVWAKCKDFEVPLIFRTDSENIQTKVCGTRIKVEYELEDEDYKFFTDNVRLDGLSYVLDLKVVQDGCTTSVKYEDPSSICRNYVNNEKQNCSLEGKENCKCMGSENKNRKRRRLFCGEEINNALVHLQSSELPVDKRQSYLQDYSQQKVKTEVPSPESSSPSDVTTVGNIECSEIPFFTQSDDFKENLEAALQKPYNTQELHDLWTSINNRKPIVRFRHTRQRTISVETQDEGFSYLDYHPDLSDRLVSATSPEDKLTLLRGFFFWLKHASWPKSFQPWVSSPAPKNRIDDDDSDCVEVDGPNSEVRSKKVVAVVLHEDER
ncbi:hypothetical protein SUGI_0490910 [Cryptomeria japonica]|uniref:uncharacterized protein LOC131039643 n=1 Tax=Cryptomeria japonica TaxID=3369 RepID=UPI002408A590|nr:uncharacterized protein LOC131039643 [Cryptomeria japonica]GLJ25625.1 hypothetical protein SUGI_0490910 [Cryptomeria japonica]